MDYAAEDAIVSRLSTGDVMVFDKGTRELYLLGEKAGARLTDGAERDPATALEYARRAAEEGHAHRYDRQDLARLRAAFDRIVLLV